MCDQMSFGACVPEEAGFDGVRLGALDRAVQDMGGG